MTYATRVIPVVGIVFVDGYPDNLHLLRELGENVVDWAEALPVILIRNPDNPYDANAVQVHVPALGAGAMIGHISKENAAKIAPLMDQGVQFHCHVADVRINPDHMDRPGIDIAITRAESAPVPRVIRRSTK